MLATAATQQQLRGLVVSQVQGESEARIGYSATIGSGRQSANKQKKTRFTCYLKFQSIESNIPIHISRSLFSSYVCV